MSNEARYERYRTELRQLQGVVQRILKHLGLEVPAFSAGDAAGEERPRRFVEGGRAHNSNSNQFGGGASMRNAVRVPRAGEPARPPVPGRRQRSQSTTGKDGTVMTVRTVSPGRPVSQGPTVAAVPPAAAAPAVAAPAAEAVPVAAPAAALPSAAELTALIGSAVADVLASLGVQQQSEHQGDDGGDDGGEGGHDPADHWMAAEGINAGPVVG